VSDLSDLEPTESASPSVWTVSVRAVATGLATLAVVLLLLHLSHPSSDVRVRYGLAQCSALTALLWVGAEGVATLPRDSRGRPSVLGWMGILLAAGACFSLLGHFAVGL
jgi:hypothetical protein